MCVHARVYALNAFEVSEAQGLGENLIRECGRQRWQIEFSISIERIFFNYPALPTGCVRILSVFTSLTILIFWIGHAMHAARGKRDVGRDWDIGQLSILVFTFLGPVKLQQIGRFSCITNHTSLIVQVIMGMQR